jgi:hypothetical protein
MDRGRRLAGIMFAVCAAALLGANATAPALSLPSTDPTGTVPSTGIPLPKPAVTTPPVSLPPVSTPQVTTPGVGTPGGTTPSVTTPKVTTPKVTVPPQSGPAPTKVTAPKVTAPKATAPKATAPKVSSPSVAVPGTGGGSSPRGPAGVVGTLTGSGGPTSGVTGGPGGGGGSSGQAGSGGQQSANSSSGALVPTAGGGPGTGPPGAPGGPGAGSMLVGPATVNVLSGGVAALQLRSALGPLLGCFYSLSPFQQEVLTLRTGLDGGAPITRAQLATAFGVSQTSMQSAERSAIHRLRLASGRDGCAAASGALSASAFISGPFGPIGFVNPVLGTSTRAAVAVAWPGVPDQSSASRSITDQLQDLGGGTGGGPHWLLMFITLMLFATFGALLREARRSV